MPTAFVTGAGSGIGRAIATSLGNRGFSVALVGRRRGPLEETAELVDAPEAMVLPADVTDADESRRAVDAAAEALGSLDVLVNCAGDAQLVGLAESTARQLTGAFAANVESAFNCTQAAWPWLSRSDFKPGPTLINVASMAVFAPLSGLEIYGAAKAALAHLTASWNAVGTVRAFCLCPGAVETAMLRRVVATSTLPPELTLSPQAIAETALQCIDGVREADRGRAMGVLPMSQRGWWDAWVSRNPSGWLGMHPVFA